MTSHMVRRAAESAQEFEHRKHLARLVHIIAQHEHAAYVVDGVLIGVAVYVKDGVVDQVEEVIEPTLPAVRDWLGY